MKLLWKIDKISVHLIVLQDHELEKLYIKRVEGNMMYYSTFMLFLSKNGGEKMERIYSGSPSNNQILFLDI